MKLGEKMLKQKKGNPSILPLRRRVEVQNRWLQERLERVLPEIMAREGFDMWIVSARQFNEDPVIMTLLPQPMMFAQRRTVLVFSLQRDGHLERVILSKRGLGKMYQQVWYSDCDDAYACLRKFVYERNPQSIGINVSQTFDVADGLTHGEYLQLASALGSNLMARVKGAERLAIGWLERRIQPEIDAYSNIVRLAHMIIQEAFSSCIIHPGITTTDDVVWWMREKIQDLRLEPSFPPTVFIQAPGQRFDGFINPGKIPTLRKIILPGDLLHCDMGIRYFGLVTDTQQLAYVLRLGEKDAPEYLKAALAQGNRVQDILLNEFRIGRTGNQILLSALDKAHKEGITAMIYSHPVGYHVHGAGPKVGLFEKQDGVPGRGDYELFDNTCHAIELNVKQAVSEWGGQVVWIPIEEDMVISKGVVHWITTRQTAFHLIG